MTRRKAKMPVSRKKIADALFDEGRWDEAIEEYKAAIALDGSDACAHFGLCDAYDKKGMTDAAIRELREAMRLKPAWPYYHNKMGKILEAAGRREEAAREYAEVVRLKSDLEGALDSLLRTSGPSGPAPLRTIINHRKLYDVVRLSAELNIFSRLGEPTTPDTLADSLGLDVIFIRYLLNALAGAGYVEMAKKGSKQYYSNTVVSRLYLSDDSPGYIGDEIFKDLETYESLRKYVDEGPEERDINKSYWTPALLKNIGAFALLGYVQEAVEKVDLAGRKTLLDIGGGHGLYSIFFTEKYPGLKATVLDLPGVLKTTRKNIKRYRAEERVKAIPGDFSDLKLKDTYDVIFVSNVTASYKELSKLLANASSALNPGGMLILRNYVSDVGEDEWSRLVVLDRYSRRGKRTFSTKQLVSAMEGCGLEDVERVHTGGGVAIVCGTLPENNSK